MRVVCAPACERVQVMILLSQPSEIEKVKSMERELFQVFKEFDTDKRQGIHTQIIYIHICIYFIGERALPGVQGVRQEARHTPWHTHTLTHSLYVYIQDQIWSAESDPAGWATIYISKCMYILHV
jgi:hypothetical protein